MPEYIDIYQQEDYIPDESCPTPVGGSDGVGISTISQIGSTNQVLITLTNGQQYTIDVPTIKGDNGEQGEQGETGEQGAQGEPGQNGEDGIDGANGTNGTNGTNGINGINGVNFLNGAGVPSSGLGSNNDAYIDYTNGFVYTKAGGVWTYRITLKGQDGEDGTQLPVGLKNQLPFYKTDNSQDTINDDILKLGAFIYTDKQLADAKTRVVTLEDIFNKWKRFSHGGNPLLSDDIPGVPLQTNSWVYDNVNKLINSTQNTASHIGFVSPKKYSSYTHSATLTSTGADNDRIGIVIAYVEDENDFVTNQAFGLNPADFNWPIDVTSEFIPNQHSLTLFRNRNGVSNSYEIWYDFNKNTNKLILSGSSLPYNFNSNWGGAEVDVQVVRNGDFITCYTTDFSDAPSGKGGLRFPISIDLNSDDVLSKFRGPSQYGYSVWSQALSSWKNINFSESDNIIYDLRNGNVWLADNTNTYNLITSRNYFTEIGIRRLLYNIDEKTLIYISEDKSIIIISNDKKILDLAADDTGGIFSNTQLNTNYPDAIVGQKVLSTTKVYEKKDTTWFYYTKTNCT